MPITRTAPESKQTLWASYTFDKLLVAAEYALNEAVGGVAADERDGYLLLGNYAVTDALSLTLRYSNTEDSGSTSGETDKYTISPTYMVTDDLALLAEYSDIEGQTDFLVSKPSTPSSFSVYTVCLNGVGDFGHPPFFTP